jgi:hypothetical protein
MNRTPSARAFALSLVFFLAFALLLVLVACQPATGQALRAIHTEGQLDRAPVVSGNLCLTCHNPHTITESTARYGGQEGLNIHEPPESMAANYGDCTSCHKVDDPPTLTCNTTACHSYNLPQGWSAP